MPTRKQFKHRASVRHTQAVARQESWAKLPYEEQLAVLAVRPGSSVKQHVKIARQIMERDSVVPKKQKEKK